VNLLKKNKDNLSKTRIFRKTRKFFKFFYIFLGFLLIGFFFLFLTKASLFKIKKFSCFVNNTPCDTLVYTKTASAVLGKNFFLTSETQLKTDLGNLFYSLNEIEVKKNFSKVMVRFNKGEPVAAIEHIGQYVLVDANGFLIERADNSSGLFLIATSGFSGFEIKDKIIEKEILKALEFSLEAKKRNLELLKAEVAEGELKFFLRNDVVVLTSIEKSSSQQIDSLQLILAKSKIDKDHLRQIDLRYENPIIR